MNWVDQKLNVEPIEEKMDKATIKVLKNVVLIPLAINLAVMFVMFQLMTRTAKEDAKRSAELRKILKDGKDWKVMIVDMKVPNAFAMVRPYVFITKGLMKMLDDREIMAVLLHEAGHITNMDVWSDLASKNALLALLISIVGTVSGPQALGVLLMIYFMGGRTVMNIVFARTLGRFKERRADSFAAKYGYADEMISALEKLEKFIQKIMKKQECNKLCQIGRKISAAIDEHPPVKERIENVLKQKETWAKKSFSALRNMFLKAFGVKEG